MAVSEDDSLLCAADQQFSVYIWNISQYALHGLEDKPPTLLHCWRAHLCDITSVIPLSKHGLVVTSSMDCTVKLWSLQGEHIGTFGQNEMWDITKKESWKEQSIVSSLNTHKSPPKPLTGTNSSLSIESNSIISEVTVSSEPIDKEIVEELKNLNILKVQNRVQQVGSKTTDIQQVCGRVNSYQSLKIFDLLYVPPTIRKPNPAAEINDPYDLSI
ncbi:uncharacterized protein LOC128648157 [Bombina bombina]|uniref:uncharacterized protein LOC128648157 n=1 Tax=Bombina bombina TaxID=8345 RepID=UPI00235A4F4B|nr:uncharacterized protein LOC128648157 [Bombina bombina]